MAKIPVYALDDIEDDSSTAVEIKQGEKTVSAMLLRKDGQIYAYVNHCPHVGVPLDFTPGQFLDIERSYIQCSTHNALFTIETGDCVFGPCSGKALSPLEVEVVDGQILLESD